MTDIVARLRTICDVLRTSRYNSVWEEDLHEAADEIARLRAERDDWYMRALKAEADNERLQFLVQVAAGALEPEHE